MRKLTTALVVAATAALLGGPAADAGTKVPLGKYKCYQFDPTVGYLYGGGFTLKRGGKYRSLSGGGGSWSHKGIRVKFRTGPYKPFFGKMRNDDNGNPVMDLFLKSDPSDPQSCYPPGSKR